MATTSLKRQTGTLWRHSSFMLFWSGETVSQFGTQVTLLALPLTAVLTLHATATQLGLVRFSEALPYVLCTLVFGAWVDRRRHKPILILANAARGILIAIVPALAILGVLQLSLVALVGFSVGVFTVLFDVTWLAYVPTLIKPDDLIEANGKVSISQSAAEVAGPGLGGLLVQTLTAPLALLGDTFSYAVAVVTLLLIRSSEPAPPTQVAQQRHLLREIGEGIHVVWADGRLRAITVMSGLWNLLSGIADTAFLLYAVRELALSPGTLGALFAAGSVGGLVGATISTRLGRRGTFGPVLGIAFTCGCVPWVLLPAIAGAHSLEFAAFTLAFFVIQLGLGLWGVLVLSLRQAITPLHLLGRVSASIRMVSYGLGALGPLLSGFLATLLGLRLTLWLAAAGFILILVITLVATPLPRVRTIPGGTAAEAE